MPAISRGSGRRSNGTSFLIGILGDRHAEQWKRGVRAGVRGEIEPRDLRVHQIGVSRLFRSIQQLLAIDDLHDTVDGSAVTEVHAVAFRPRGDRAVYIGRYRSCRSGLLARQ